MASGSKAKFGNDWTYRIYFAPEADQSRCYNIEDEELIEKMKTLVDKDENIKMVYAYKHPLSEWQLTDFILHHMFIIFETRRWWWSIEKNTSGITIQRSKHLNAVLDRYRQSDRVPGIKNVGSHEGKLSVFDLIYWLYQSNELNKEYNALSSNCQHFAKAVFDHVALRSFGSSCNISVIDDESHGQYFLEVLFGIYQ